MTKFSPPTRPRILLVDDETELRMLTGMILSDEGYEVSHAASVNEALRLHRENPFDLIIAELVMKDRSGFQTLAELRRQPAPARFIATAKSSWLPPEHFLKMARQLGAHSALSKPFQHEEMLEAVREALK
jgi:two-component system, NtrC family, response regulator GlrR